MIPKKCSPNTEPDTGRKPTQYYVFDLKAATHDRYKITLEESWYHERPEVRNPERRWYEQIPCKGGAFIGLYCETGDILLQLSTPRPKNARLIYEKINHHPKVQADFHFDGEAIIYFPPELVHIVAEMAGARKKRRLSADARTRLKEAGKATQFQPRICGVENEETGHI